MCLFAFNVSEVVDTFSWTLHVWTRVTVKLQITMLPNLVAGQDQSSPWMMQKPLHVEVLKDHLPLKDHNFAIMPSTVFPFLIFCYMEYSSSWWGSTYNLYSQLNITRNGIGSDLCVILRAPPPPPKKKKKTKKEK